MKSLIALLVLVVASNSVVFGYEDQCYNAHDRERLMLSSVIRYIKDGGAGFVIKQTDKGREFGSFYSIKKVKDKYEFLNGALNNSATYFSNDCLVKTLLNNISSESVQDISDFYGEGSEYQKCVKYSGEYNIECSMIHSKVWGQQASKFLDSLN